MLIIIAVIMLCEDLLLIVGLLTGDVFHLPSNCCSLSNIKMNVIFSVGIISAENMAGAGEVDV